MPQHKENISHLFSNYNDGLVYLKELQNYFEKELQNCKWEIKMIDSNKLYLQYAFKEYLLEIVPHQNLTEFGGEINVYQRPQNYISTKVIEWEIKHNNSVNYDGNGYIHFENTRYTIDRHFAPEFLEYISSEITNNYFSFGGV